MESKTDNKKLCEELDNSQKSYREFQKKFIDMELELQEKEKIIVTLKDEVKDGKEKLIKEKDLDQNQVRENENEIKKVKEELKECKEKLKTKEKDFKDKQKALEIVNLRMTATEKECRKKEQELITCRNHEEILREQIKVLNSTVSDLQKEKEIQKELTLSIISGGEEKCLKDNSKLAGSVSQSQGNIYETNLKDAKQELKIKENLKEKNKEIKSLSEVQ